MVTATAPTVRQNSLTPRSSEERDVVMGEGGKF